MRNVLYGAACSLDGYIARSDDGVDWLHFSEDVAAISAEYWKTIDTVVMGRRTYEVARRLGTSGYPGVKNYVFSGTLDASAAVGVEVIAEDAGDFVRRLKGEEGAGICVMGGGVLARSLLEAGVIDEVGLNVHPVLLGSGIPMFPGTSLGVDLLLAECRPIDGGCVYLRYRVR